MVRPILQTKLFIPPPRPQLIPRPHLLSRLDQGLARRHKLTLLCAPAGYGKTMLLAEWIASLKQGGTVEEPDVAWLSLDPGDNDPIRFVTYLAGTLQTIQADLGEGIQDALISVQPPPLHDLLTGLINQLVTYQERVVLVLDDYHFVHAQDVHDALTFLMDHQPANLHLVIASRADPPLPITRLRARGQLTELRQPDLRFSDREAQDFMNQGMSLELRPEITLALNQRSEGWVAGLQMAALALHSHRDIDAFVESFSGRHEYIVAYLTDEVFAHQPADVQAFLLRTSILERLSAPLCSAVTASGTVEAGGILEYLDRVNLFVVPLDDEGRWYRYHQLFAELLRERLHQRLAADEIVALQYRASLWYAADGQAEPAIAHAMEAGDLERAADLVAEAAEATLMRSELLTLLHWVERLPDVHVRARPDLGLLHAWALLMTGRSSDALEGRLAALEESGPPGGVAAVRAFAALSHGHLARAQAMAQQATAELPETMGFLRHMATWILGLAALAEGDLREGTRLLEQVLQVGREQGNAMVAVTALSHLAESYRLQGRLAEARITYERALHLGTNARGDILPVAGRALLGLGRLWYEWNDLARAVDHLERGIRLVGQWHGVAAVDGYVPLACVRQALGDEAGACAALDAARDLAASSHATRVDDRLVAQCQARLWLAQGNVQAVAAWAASQGLWDEPGSGSSPEAEATTALQRLRKHDLIVLARLLLVQDRPAAALALLDWLWPGVELRGHVAPQIEVQLLRALALEAAGDPEEALSATRLALSLAEPGGYLRIFAGEGARLVPLLRQAAGRGYAIAYVGRILKAMDAVAQGPSSLLLEPLSDREIEILCLIAAGLSNREIAEHFVLATSTVKWHINNLYGKLGVRSRTQAVARARELGLL